MAKDAVLQIRIHSGMKGRVMGIAKARHQSAAQFILSLLEEEIREWDYCEECGRWDVGGCRNCSPRREPA